MYVAFNKIMTRISDLPPELVGMIFTKIAITSMHSVRSTCKLWKALTKDWILSKAVARQQFLGFTTMDSKVCSLRLHLSRKDNGKEDEDLVDLSIKQVDLLNQVDISKVFHCDGLMLCVAKDKSRLMVWNPYLGQTRWIRSRTNFHTLDTYALGYDVNRNHKILSFLDPDSFERKALFGYEIYDFSSNSWKVLDITSNWCINSHQRGVSLKGNSYFFAQEKLGDFSGRIKLRPNLSSKVKRLPDGGVLMSDDADFLLCFDFTRERFGPRLPLPFHSNTKWTTVVAISCVKEEKLAMLHQHMEKISCILQIWITTTIEANTLSWSKFLRVEMRPIVERNPFRILARSFFIDEEEKVVVVFDVNENLLTKTAPIVEDRYFKSLSYGEAPIVGETCPLSGDTARIYCTRLDCSSSYFPSLVQLNQPRKRKERDN